MNIIIFILNKILIKSCLIYVIKPLYKLWSSFDSSPFFYVIHRTSHPPFTWALSLSVIDSSYNSLAAFKFDLWYSSSATRSITGILIFLTRLLGFGCIFASVNVSMGRNLLSFFTLLSCVAIKVILYFSLQNLPQYGGYSIFIDVKDLHVPKMTWVLYFTTYLPKFYILT